MAYFGISALLYQRREFFVIFVYSGVVFALFMLAYMIWKIVYGYKIIE